MTHRIPARALLLAAVLVAVPSLGEAGPPLLCHPFQTSGGELLPWGSGSQWHSPDPEYNVRHLTADLLRLLTAETPLLTRMENMRRAVIYATEDARVADELLGAFLARARSASGESAAAALFDAGYLIETYKQASHRHRRAGPDVDGYALVRRALAMSGGSPDMEFAASLMTTGAQADAHLRRARDGASALLAQNIVNQGR